MRGQSRLAFWLLVLIVAGMPSCGGYINNPSPVATSLDPPSVLAGQALFTLKVLGSNFTPTSTVLWSGSATGGNATPLTTTIFMSQSEMTAQVPTTLVQNPGTAKVTVFTPTPGGGTSAPLIFTINPTASPVPEITSLNPATAIAGTGGFTLVITGNNFVSTSVGTVNNTNRGTFVSNSTTISISVTAGDLASAGTLQIAVVNPPVTPPPPPPLPNGGTSDPFPLEVLNPAPRIDTLAPTGAVAGTTTPPTLTVTGTGMVTGSQIEINGAVRSTFVLSATQATTTLTAADLAVGGIDQVQVVNPGPGGGTSNTLTFSVNPTKSAGLPILVDLAPDGSPANDGVCGTTCAGGVPTLATAGPSASTTGKFIAFASLSTNLVTGQIGSASDIFLRDTCLGGSATCVPLTTLLSTDPSGHSANGASSEPSLDSNGANIAFTSAATNLVTTVPLSGATTQVFWRPTCAGSTTCTSSTAPTQLVSISADGLSAGDGDSFNPAIDPSGRYVAFISRATNLVSNMTFDGATPQVFLRDTCSGQTSATCTPATFLVSAGVGATQADGAGANPSVATGGLYVSFTSTATNLGAPAPNPGGAQEIFVRTCATAVSTCTPGTQLVSTPGAGGTPANGASSESAINTEGRFIAFASTATNLGVNSGGVQQVYVRDTCVGAVSTCTQTTVLISTADGTTPANGASERPSIDDPALNSNGLLVAFASVASNLAANTLNGVENVFVRNTCTAQPSTTTSCAPSTILASLAGGNSPPAANAESVAPSIGPDGHTISFLSAASNLVSRDTNGFVDVFLATTTF